MTQTIAISNQKGGVGKTTTAVNLAACLADLGHRTLLVDLDPQSNASSALGFDSNRLDASIYDALLDHAAPTVHPLDAQHSNLFLLPSSMDLAGAEFELIDREGRETALRDALARLDQPFDYILIDSPPSLGLLTLNALVAARWVLIPVQAEYLALEGLSRMVQTIQRINRKQNPELEILGLLATLYDSRTNLAHQVLEELRRAFPDKVFSTPVTRSVRLSEAPSYGQTILRYDARSSGALQYQQIAQEVIHVCEKASLGSRA
ncbi:MAG TPA: ParA family protein [Candidatus Sumerlaeota bacterium]|nr:MAG: Sporulation initiation inhibitor protein Soj [candidate division BRC1 bacterium ADurb.BinA292]HOE96170.1 ParA family protein [Candidatus Sumerlaeota bacterium]